MINFDTKTIAFLVFIISNLASIILLRSRVNLVISLAISCLILVFFTSISLTNYLLFGNLAITFIAYFFVSTLLVLNCPRHQESTTANKWRLSLVIVVSIIISCASILIIKSMPQVAELAANKNQNFGQNLATAEATIGNITNNFSTKDSLYFTNKMSNSLLLRHYCDMILAIVAIATCLLISSQKKSES